MNKTLFDLDIDRESPFEAGTPVSPDNFKGRIDTIKKIVRYAPTAQKGNVRHFFLTGKRCMGKTSLAKYVQNYLENNIGMTGVYVSNKGNHSLKELVTSIIEGFIKQIPKEGLKEKFKNIFGSVESISFKGASISFNPDNSMKEDIIGNFPYIINDLIKELPKGVFLVVDDINGLSESKQFVDWYKKFADTVEMDDNLNIPLYVLFAGYPEKFDELVLKEESFGRIFHHEDISNLEDKDVEDFFIDTFSKANLHLNQESLEILTFFSSGLPLMMQQIGDSVFWMADEENISKEISIKGVIDAANEIGRKQIRPMLNTIRSENYEPILLELGKLKAFKFKKSEIQKKLSKNQQNVFKDFLSRMVELNILCSVGKKKSGQYEFNNQLYFVYFLIKSELKDLN